MHTAAENQHELGTPWLLKGEESGSWRGGGGEGRGGFAEAEQHEERGRALGGGVLWEASLLQLKSNTRQCSMQSWSVLLWRHCCTQGGLTLMQPLLLTHVVGLLPAWEQQLCQLCAAVHMLLMLMPYTGMHCYMVRDQHVVFM